MEVRRRSGEVRRLRKNSILNRHRLSPTRSWTQRSDTVYVSDEGDGVFIKVRRIMGSDHPGT